MCICLKSWTIGQSWMLFQGNPHAENTCVVVWKGIQNHFRVRCRHSPPPPYPGSPYKQNSTLKSEILKSLIIGTIRRRRWHQPWNKHIPFHHLSRLNFERDFLTPRDPHVTPTFNLHIWCSPHYGNHLLWRQFLYSKGWPTPLYCLPFTWHGNTVDSYFSMPSEIVLEENLIYPEIIQGTWMLVVTNRAESLPVRVICTQCT